MGFHTMGYYITVVISLSWPFSFGTGAGIRGILPEYGDFGIRGHPLYYFYNYMFNCLSSELSKPPGNITLWPTLLRSFWMIRTDSSTWQTIRSNWWAPAANCSAKWTKTDSKAKWWTASSPEIARHSEKFWRTSCVAIRITSKTLPRFSIFQNRRKRLVRFFPSIRIMWSTLAGHMDEKRWQTSLKHTLETGKYRSFIKALSLVLCLRALQSLREHISGDRYIYYGHVPTVYPLGEKSGLTDPARRR